MPEDAAIVPISRTVGQTRLVDEVIHTFTHSIKRPWVLPGISPTHKRVAVPLVVVVEFRNGKIQNERI